jgi:hypothetical protein
MSVTDLSLTVTQQLGAKGIENCVNPRTQGGLLPSVPITLFPLEGEICTVIVDKTTHRIRVQNETESGVVIVIEPKE